MYFGVYFGLQRGFVFCRGRKNSQPYDTNEVPPYCVRCMYSCTLPDAIHTLELRSRPPFAGVGRKLPQRVLFECFWAPGSECPKSKRPSSDTFHIAQYLQR